MYYIYLIRSTVKNWVYIGSTDDLRKRFQEHNSGKTTSTKAYKPFKLIYYEAYQDKSDAKKREIELKSHGQKKEILQKQIENSLKT
jgi:putative endonuclease